MKSAVRDLLRSRIVQTPASSWKVTATPPRLDVAAKSPEGRTTATLMTSNGPVATFWSYLMDGAAHAAAARWLVHHAEALIDGTISRDEAGAGLDLVARMPYRDLWVGPTPHYLTAGDRNTLTLRTPQHTEEVATFWGPMSETNIALVAALINAATDLLSDALGVPVVLWAMLSRSTIDGGLAEATLEAVAKVARDGLFDLPVETALSVFDHARLASWSAEASSLSVTPLAVREAYAKALAHRAA